MMSSPHRRVGPRQSTPVEVAGRRFAEAGEDRSPNTPWHDTGNPRVVEPVDRDPVEPPGHHPQRRAHRDLDGPGDSSDVTRDLTAGCPEAHDQDVLAGEALGGPIGGAVELLAVVATGQPRKARAPVRRQRAYERAVAPSLAVLGNERPSLAILLRARHGPSELDMRPEPGVRGQRLQMGEHLGVRGVPPRPSGDPPPPDRHAQLARVRDQRRVAGRPRARLVIAPRATDPAARFEQLKRRRPPETVPRPQEARILPRRSRRREAQLR